MAYVRKTRDEYQLLIDYRNGYGWEIATTEETAKAIKERRREYRENCPEYPTKVIKRRVPIDKED